MIDDPVAWMGLVIAVIAYGYYFLVERAKYDLKRRKKRIKTLDYDNKVCYNSFINGKGIKK